MKNEKYFDKKIEDIFPTNEIKNLMIQTFLGHGALMALFIGSLMEKDPKSVPYSVQYAGASICYHLKCVIENLPSIPGVMCTDLNDIREQDEETYLRKLKLFINLIKDNLEKESNI